jgi:hypothetical protein
MKHTQGKWTVENSGGTVVSLGGRLPVVICELADAPVKITREVEANAKLIAAAPLLLEACKEAAILINIARLYFPKSIKDCNKFQLENTNATINKAISQAESEE